MEIYHLEAGNLIYPGPGFLMDGVLFTLRPEFLSSMAIRRPKDQPAADYL